MNFGKTREHYNIPCAGGMQEQCKIPSAGGMQYYDGGIIS